MQRLRGVVTPQQAIPPHLLEAWLEILNLSERNNGRNYPRAMQLAGEWGKRLAEWEMGQ
jgi:hypothetical protein